MKILSVGRRAAQKVREEAEEKAAQDGTTQKYLLNISEIFYHIKEISFVYYKLVLWVFGWHLFAPAMSLCTLFTSCPFFISIICLQYTASVSVQMWPSGLLEWSPRVMRVSDLINWDVLRFLNLFVVTFLIFFLFNNFQTTFVNIDKLQIISGSRKDPCTEHIIDKCVRDALLSIYKTVMIVVVSLMVCELSSSS